MTRGKHGDASAKRRAQAKDEVRIELERRYRQQIDALRIEVAELRQENLNLGGRLTKDAERLSSTRVQHVTEQAAKDLAAAETEYLRRLTEFFRWVADDDNGMVLRIKDSKVATAVVRASEILGCQPSVILPSANRTQRRNFETRQRLRNVGGILDKESGR